MNTSTEEIKLTIGFDEWLSYNHMKPTKKAKRMWLKEEQIRAFLVEALDKLKPLEQWRAHEIQPKRSIQLPKRSHIFRYLVSAAAVCIMCLGIVLPLTLTPNSHGSNLIVTPTEPKGYSLVNVSIDNETTVDEIYGRNDISFFNQSEILSPIVVYYDKPSEDAVPAVLSYLVNDCLIGIVDSENSIYVGFYVDYRVRLYKKYDFVGIDNYKSLIESFDNPYDHEVIKDFSIDNIFVRYREPQGSTNTYAYIMFTFGGNDYFLKVTEMSPMCPINETNLSCLIEALIYCSGN